jgi:hypothetical protein
VQPELQIGELLQQPIRPLPVLVFLLGVLALLIVFSVAEQLRSRVGDGSSAGEGQIVYRVWGGDSPPWGSSWTPEDPRRYGPDKYRAAAGLPDMQNNGTLFTRAMIDDPSRVVDVHNSEPMEGPPESYCAYPDPTVLEYIIPSGLGLIPIEITPLSPPYGGPPRNGCP